MLMPARQDISGIEFMPRCPAPALMPAHRISRHLLSPCEPGASSVQPWPSTDSGLFRIERHGRVRRRGGAIIARGRAAPRVCRRKAWEHRHTREAEQALARKRGWWSRRRSASTVAKIFGQPAPRVSGERHLIIDKDDGETRPILEQLAVLPTPPLEQHGEGHFMLRCQRIAPFCARPTVCRLSSRSSGP